MMVDIILIFLYNFRSLALSSSYIYIGFTLSALSLLIAVNSVFRMCYLAYRKYIDALGE